MGKRPLCYVPQKAGNTFQGGRTGRGMKPKKEKEKEK